MPVASITAARRYPVGIQTFAKIREGGFVYVDKTRCIYDLAHGSGAAFCLTRPRRFGKSLLLSTMQAYCYGLCIDSGYIAANEVCAYAGVIA